MISYSPLFKTLKEKHISQYQLEHMGIDNKVMDRLRHNVPVQSTTINKLCLLLDCTPNDVMEIIRDQKELAELERQKKPTKYPRPK